MPRVPKVPKEEVVKIILEKKTQVVTDGKIAVPSDTVWRELSQNLKGVMSSKALYTLVKRNGHNIWQHLGLESVLIKHEQEPDQKALHEPQETSSSSSSVHRT